MCGINGFNFSSKDLITSMNNSIIHRGPDDVGSYITNNLSLGHVRLSIVDISEAGHQPMFYSKLLGASNKKFNSENISKSEYSLIYNGEIYNFVEIKDELKTLGYTFSTKCDTEIILAAYDCWGEECVNKFNGMWAFALFDYKKNILFCSRDRLGQKPLYYYYNHETFIFSSELKGILEHKNLKLNSLKNISIKAVQLYFSLGFIPSPHSIYKDVFKLEASHNLIFDLEKSSIVRYYKYFSIKNYKPIYDKKKLIQKGRELLIDATKLRMRSDVPVGSFLSGGVDSSSVVASMKTLTNASKLHTFSVGFRGENYDETPYINIVKDYLRTNHHHTYFNKNMFNTLQNSFSYVYDEPFGDYSGYPTLQVSELASQFVKVSLSGDGGDEIFAGYNMHLVGARMDVLNKTPKLIRKLGKNIPAKVNMNSYVSLYSLKKAFELSLLKREDFYISIIGNERYSPHIFKQWGRKTFKDAYFRGDKKLSEALRIHDLMHRSLADNFLVKVDRASMYYGLEVRSPFLDYRFIEFSQKIPTKYKISVFSTKKILKEICKDILPQSILHRKKQGFTSPLEEWILSKEYREYIVKNITLLKNFDEELYQYYKTIVLSRKDRVYKYDLIRLYIFLQWYNQWIKD